MCVLELHKAEKSKRAKRKHLEEHLATNWDNWEQVGDMSGYKNNILDRLSLLEVKTNLFLFLQWSILWISHILQDMILIKDSDNLQKSLYTRDKDEINNECP